MKITVCENYDEMSEKAAEIVAEQIRKNPKSVLGLATGSTPVGMYDELSKMNKSGEIDFKSIRTFNLDEYYPLTADNEQSYHCFMNKNFFSKINIDTNNTHILDGMCNDTEKECENFEKLIGENGGIDLQILGIGQNGHIGFNEPSENLNSKTHLTNLTEDTIKANSRFFDDISEVPKKALTMGMGTILKARKIILLAAGKNKHKAVSELLTSNISTEMPASMLKLHSDVTLICDKDAYSSERIGVDIGGTEVKFGVLNENDETVYKTQISSACLNCGELIDSIADKCREIMKEYCISGIGVGTAGIIRDGIVNAVNLPFKDIDLKKELENRLNISVKVSNDANCAALGEAVCGSGQSVKNLVMVSLGTGVGGGIIIDGKIYEGKGSAGEIGHFPVNFDGEKCSCGLNGCFEQYASAAALIGMAEKAAKINTDSILYKLYIENRNSLNGKLFFRAVNEKCAVAAEVLDKYINRLSIGIKGIINVFDPDMIVLSGGITNAGDTLLKPLKDRINSDTPIAISKLKSDAGIVGAALLV